MGRVCVRVRVSNVLGPGQGKFSLGFIRVRIRVSLKLGLGLYNIYG